MKFSRWIGACLWVMSLAQGVWGATWTSPDGKISFLVPEGYVFVSSEDPQRLGIWAKDETHASLGLTDKPFDGMIVTPEFIAKNIQEQAPGSKILSTGRTTLDGVMAVTVDWVQTDDLGTRYCRKMFIFDQQHYYSFSGISHEGPVADDPQLVSAFESIHLQPAPSHNTPAPTAPSGGSNKLTIVMSVLLGVLILLRILQVTTRHS